MHFDDDAVKIQQTAEKRVFKLVSDEISES
jgi:hypothetical protein